MRAILIALLSLATHAKVYTQACCCNSAGGNYAILPNIDKHLAGLRYSFSNYNSTIYPDMGSHVHTPGMDMSAMGAGKPAVEMMHTIDAFARFNLPARFQLSAFVPVHILTETSEGATKRFAGLGDVSVLLQYAVINNNKCNGKKGKHQVRLGAGVKAPTGKFKMSADGMFTTDLQLGTGSVDFLMNAIYTYRYKNIGVNLLGSYKKNLVNRQQFRFGDKARAGANLFYVFNPKKDWMLMPLLGANYDHVFYNHLRQVKLTYTGGDYVTGNVGFDVYYKHIAWSSSFAPVLLSVQNWEGQPVQLFTFETGLYFNF